MILGHIHIDAERRSVDTHRDSYLLDGLTVVSVRRPFVLAGVMFGAGFAGFTVGFADLLYPQEIATTLSIAGAALLLGWQVGQLKLLSRDLRGSELAEAVWGRYSRLNRIRREIAWAMTGKGGAK